MEPDAKRRIDLGTTSKTCRLNPKVTSSKQKKQQKPKVTIDAHEAQSEVETGSEATTSSSESESDESHNRHEEGSRKQVTYIDTHYTKYSLSTSIRAHQTSFDVTSKPIGIDTCATASISGNREDFIGKLEPIELTKN